MKKVIVPLQIDSSKAIGKIHYSKNSVTIALDDVTEPNYFENEQKRIIRVSRNMRITSISFWVMCLIALSKNLYVLSICFFIMCIIGVFITYLFLKTSKSQLHDEKESI